MIECPFAIFSGSSHEDLARRIAADLGTSLGSVFRETFPDGEIGIQIQENVRGKDVFIVQSLARNPNRNLMELLIMVDALKRASARSVIAVLPYFAYARQDRKDKGRVPITARLVANLLEKAGVARVLTMDLHTEQIQGFFDIPVDNLYARPILVRTLQEKKVENLIVVSPDVGSNKLARKFAEDLDVGLAIVDKRRIDSRRVDVHALIGDVEGRNVVLVDDMCSTGSTLKLAAQVCREYGAKSVRAAVTHALLLGGGFEEVGIEEIIATDTVAPGSQRATIVSVAPLFAQAIGCVVAARSISSLYAPKSKVMDGYEKIDNFSA